MDLLVCTYCGENKNIVNKNGLVSCGSCKSILTSYCLSGDTENTVNDFVVSERVKGGKLIAVETFSTTYNHLWQSLENLIRRVKIFDLLTVLQKKNILVNATAILHHSQMLWSGWVKFGDSSVSSIQLPKDCMIRLSATIYYVINDMSDVMLILDFNRVLDELFCISKQKKKRGVFLNSIFNFISMIQEFNLGGSNYLEVKKIILHENYDYFEENDSLIKDVDVIKMYEKKLRAYFWLNIEYVKHEEECIGLFKRVMHDVVLEGKGPKMAMMVVVFYVTKLKDVLKECVFVEKRKNNISKRQRTMKKKIDNNIENAVLSILENDKNYFNALYSYFLFNSILDEKVNDRKKINFLKNVNIFINYISDRSLNDC